MESVSTFITSIIVTTNLFFTSLKQDMHKQVSTNAELNVLQDERRHMTEETKLLFRGFRHNLLRTLGITGAEQEEEDDEQEPGEDPKRNLLRMLEDY